MTYRRIEIPPQDVPRECPWSCIACYASPRHCPDLACTLLPDTETGKDQAEHIVRWDLARDRAEIIESCS